MKRLLNRFFCFVLVLFLISTSFFYANAESMNNLNCAIYNNINEKVRVDKLEQVIFGYDFATGNMGVLNTNMLNESSYIKENVIANITNDGTIKEGDYFTYELDKASRLGGFLIPEAIKVDDIYVVNPQGVSEVFAYAFYDASKNIITYVLSDFIEKVNSVDFDLEQGWIIKSDIVKYNGAYTFKDKFANKEISYTYEIDYGANYDERMQGNTFSLVSRFLNINPNDKTYEQIGILNPRGQAFSDGFAVEYISGVENGEYVTPLNDQSIFKIFEVPDDYQIPDTFNIEFDKLNDVTDTFAKLSGLQGFTKYEMPMESTSKRYIFYLKNNYLSRKEQNADGVMVETQRTISSGFNVVITNSANTNHTVSNKIMEDTFSSLAGGADARKSYCQRDRKLSIEKSDLVDANKKLEGAKFEIRKDGNVLETITTDSNGVAYSSKLPLGTYIIKEVEAPSGYEILNEETSIELVSTDESIKILNITNKKIPEVIKPTPLPTPTPKVTPSPTPEIKKTCEDEGKVWDDSKQMCVVKTNKIKNMSYKVPNTSVSLNITGYALMCFSATFILLKRVFKI